jgi:malic enzyme
MFLTKKQSGEVKAQACTNDSVQRQHVAKSKAAAPTVTTEAIFVQATIFAHKKRDIPMCYTPGAFLQEDNPDA